MRTGGRLQVEIRDVYYIEAVLSGEAGSVGVCPFCIPVKKIRLGIPLNFSAKGRPSNVCSGKPNITYLYTVIRVRQAFNRGWREGMR